MNKNNTYGPGYWVARDVAFARSNGKCQFCGKNEAEEAHHWELRYSKDDTVTGNHLTALCHGCHMVATEIRQMQKSNIPDAIIHSLIHGGLQTWHYTKSKSQAILRLSCTTDRRASIQNIRPTLKKLRLRERKPATELLTTKPESGNSNAISRSGSTRRASRPSREPRFVPVSKRVPGR